MSIEDAYAVGYVGRIAGDILICIGCFTHMVGAYRYYRARSDMPFRARIFALVVFFVGALLLTLWDIFEIAFGASGIGVIVRLGAGIIAVATGAYAINRAHLEYFKKLNTVEACSEHMDRINALTAELREARHGR